MGDGSPQTTANAATQRPKLQTKLAISPSHGTLALGQPVPLLGGVAAGLLILKSLVCWGISPTGNAGPKLKSAALEADALPIGRRGGSKQRSTAEPTLTAVAVLLQR